MVIKKRKPEKIELKLLNALQNPTIQSSQLSHMNYLPLYISDNMRHSLRSYQIGAIQNLDMVRHMQAADTLYNQLMFYMATGSGKTDIMAATVLYLYHEFHYQCFLFTTHTTAVVNKTLDNFINTTSPKYLFNNPISIDGSQVTIKAVNTFPAELDPDIIYMKFTGIQQLSNDIYTPHENEITEESLAQHKVVILADEAHHFNVGTRSKQSSRR